jgi:hypothetical protein
METGDSLEVLGVLGLEVGETSVVLGDDSGGKGGEDSESELHYCVVSDWILKTHNCPGPSLYIYTLLSVFPVL